MIMAPSVIFVLMWRLNLQILYPYDYMGCSLQGALNNEHLIWSKGDPYELQMRMYLRDSFRTTLMLVLMMEMMQAVDAAINVPIPMVMAVRL
ncbi:uncharacterized protein LOC108109565 [Drosophila eugracilis]|uniref:uncharacterized protein LOC108109565 n=1 Tax=Drosophila eugracilis TaxID=29029 RepID=UPI0007E77688|nr:uncharacterized protein LOC108109565 [Drosophila eugracilis]